MVWQRQALQTTSGRGLECSAAKSGVRLVLTISGIPSLGVVNATALRTVFALQAEPRDACA
jgi:hypothetical protein